MITFEIDDIRSMNSSLKRFIDYLKNSGVGEDCVFYSRLVSCELLTNAIRHCGGTACFSGKVADGDVVICVHSASSVNSLPKPTLPDALEESGRGLYIINAVSGGNVVFSGGNVTVTLRKDITI